MLILSLNVRGLGGKTKTLSLRSLFSSLKPDFILLQETMCSAHPALFAFSKLLPSWEFCAIDAIGFSGASFQPGTLSKLDAKIFKHVLDF